MATIKTIDGVPARTRIIDKAKIEKAKKYQANMAAGKARKQADNLSKLLSDPVHSENYEKLKKVVRAYNTAEDLLRNNNMPKDQVKQLLQLRRNIEFVALNMNNSFAEWFSPLSPKQMVFVEKALALVEQSPELFI